MTSARRDIATGWRTQSTTRRLRAIAREVIEGEPAKLLETLATRIAERALALPRVSAVSVRVAKRPPSMQPIEAAAVHINRTRE